MDVFQEIENQTTLASIPPSELVELKLDGVEITNISLELKEKLSEFINLNLLTMNECNLMSLENFPDLPNLTRLELCDNFFDGDSLQYLTNSKKLQSLVLGGNKIRKMEDIESLKNLENLIELDFLGSEICEVENFKENIFASFKKLLLLNNLDIDGNDLDEWGSEDIEGEVVDVLSDNSSNVKETINNEKKKKKDRDFIPKENDFILIDSSDSEEITSLNNKNDAESYFKGVLKGKRKISANEKNDSELLKKVKI